MLRYYIALVALTTVSLYSALALPQSTMFEHGQQPSFQDRDNAGSLQYDYFDEPSSQDNFETSSSNAKKSVAQDLKLSGMIGPDNFYYPKNVFESFDAFDQDRLGNIESASTSKMEMGKIAHSFVLKKLGFENPQDLRIASQFTDHMGVSHIYLNHVVNGVPVLNHNAAVHLKGNLVTSFSSSFNQERIEALSIRPIQVSIDLEESVKAAEEKLGAAQDSHPPSFAYLETASGELVYCYNVQLRDDDTSKWFAVAIDTMTGEIQEVVNYYKSGSYKSLKIPHFTPMDAEFELVEDPEHKFASPEGWHSDGYTKWEDTRGNNVDVFVGNLNGYRPKATSNLVFSSDFNSSKTPLENKDVSSIHVFSLINTAHDIFYMYGFTEAAGNFQENNFGRGGCKTCDKDRVEVNNLNPRGKDNANMATPPDGQKPRMNMYVFDMKSHKRDGSLDSSIPIHEFGHGISGRLTGGATQARCLSTWEAGGMGEGWSDAFSLFLGRKETDKPSTDYSLGWYLVGNDRNIGFRSYPYSTSLNVNPLKLNSLLRMAVEVHNFGEVWASMLNEIYWNLVSKYGFEPDWYNSSSKKGNIVAMNLIMGGLMLQPCNPTFFDARNALVQADINYYNGEHLCEIWNGFARRGFGVDADPITYENAYSTGEACKKGSKRRRE